MNERIKQVRISNDKTQLEFANSLGLTRNYIAMIEIGQREPSDRTIADICRIFNINGTWLRTGEGEMQTPISRDAAIAAFMDDVMSSEDASFRKRLVAALSKLDVSEWELLEKVARNLAAESKEQVSANQSANFPIFTYPERFGRQAVLSSPVVIPGADEPAELSQSDADPENTP